MKMYPKENTMQQAVRNHIPNVHKDDKVIMTNRYNVPNEHKGVIWTVRTEPKYVNGKRCVQLDNYTRWYPVDGLQIVG